MHFLALAAFVANFSDKHQYNLLKIILKIPKKTILLVLSKIIIPEVIRA